MALSMHTNYASLVTQNNLNRTNDLLNTSMERLSTGLRINSAADDAAGLQISNRLEMQNRGMSVAMRNSQDGISMLQTAEGAMDEMTNIAYRMNDLATQASNGTNTASDRQALSAEFNQLASELENIFANSNFGGQSLFSGSDSLTSSSISLQIGSTTQERLDVDVQKELNGVQNVLTTFSTAIDIDALKEQANNDYQAELDAFATGGATTLTDGTAGTAPTGTYSSYADLQAKANSGDATAVADLTQVEADAKASVTSEIQGNSDGNYVAANSGVALGAATFDSINALTSGISDQASATTAMNTVAGLIDDIGAARAQFGANINRLDHTITNLQNMSENLAASKGRITDADFAVESANMTKNQMLMQAGTQMLAQSKQLPGMAMSLLG